ncbi:hypothetical protein EJ04DRAFT_162771 [Polyplosphaeria fusca]|uniref:Uncharacterized protein n=1 Tax=Polyplosphaeria fusca TaxID=682080 RepID=A0A9P4RC38_9PLEO|nr:hypothetical protein EJ04DRAFT_162771 [Polyplosphaeria fusca]
MDLPASHCSNWRANFRRRAIPWSVVAIIIMAIPVIAATSSSHSDARLVCARQWIVVLDPAVAHPAGPSHGLTKQQKHGARALRSLRIWNGCRASPSSRCSVGRRKLHRSPLDHRRLIWLRLDLQSRRGRLIPAHLPWSIVLCRLTRFGDTPGDEYWRRCVGCNLLVIKTPLIAQRPDRANIRKGASFSSTPGPVSPLPKQGLFQVYLSLCVFAAPCTSANTTSLITVSIPGGINEIENLRSPAASLVKIMFETHNLLVVSHCTPCFDLRAEYMLTPRLQFHPYLLHV